jgi:hypothetical protein
MSAFVQQQFMKAVHRCAADIRRAHPVRPPPKPDPVVVSSLRCVFACGIPLLQSFTTGHIPQFKHFSIDDLPFWLFLRELSRGYWIIIDGFIVKEWMMFDWFGFFFEHALVFAGADALADQSGDLKVIVCHGGVVRPWEDEHSLYPV